jgi:hypothetical protein
VLKLHVNLNYPKPTAMNHPNESRTPGKPVLIEQFRCKGYQCTEIVEQDATIIIFSHEKKAGHLQEHLFEEIQPFHKN